MANTTKRKGFNPVLAFILGFLVGLVFLIGSVVAAVFFALNYKIDNISQNKDADGNYIIINGNPETGGAETVLELFMRVTELASEESLSLGKIEELLPIANSLCSGVVDSLSQFVDIDYDELKSVAFSDYGTFFSDRIMEIRPAALLESFGGGSITQGDFGGIIEIILYGKEAVYVENDGMRYPVYYDTYYKGESGFVRGDGVTLHSKHEIYLTEKGDSYRLYFFRNDSGVFYVTERGADGNFVYTNVRYDNYDGAESTLTGTYYTDNSGERVGDDVTLKNFADGSAFSALNEVYVSDLIDGGSEEDELTKKILGDLTLGELMGGADLGQIISNLEVYELVDVDPTNNLMVYLSYGVTGVFNDGNGNYTGKYVLENGNEVTCYLDTAQTEDGLKITDAYYFEEDGSRQKVHATKVSELNDRIANLTHELALADLIGISAPSATDDNAIMIFLAFSVADAEAAEGDGYDYTGKYYYGGGEEWVDCYLIARDGVITDAYYYDADGVKTSVVKTSIDGTSEQVGKLTSTLKIKYLLNVEDNRILSALKDSTIDSLPADVNNLSINELYADNIYAPYAVDKDDPDNTAVYNAQTYLAVAQSEMSLATEFIQDCIYYLKDGGNYVLANTTGKLDGFEDGKDYYTCGSGKILFDCAYLYYTLENGAYKLVNGNGKLEDLPDGEYFTYGAANAMWKLLLYSNGSETAFSVNSLTSMVTNVTSNTKHAKMRELHEAGIMTFDDENDLDTKITVTKDGIPEETTVGELTLQEFVNFFVSVAKQPDFIKFLGGTN